MRHKTLLLVFYNRLIMFIACFLIMVFGSILEKKTFVISLRYLAEIRHDLLFCKEGCDNLTKFPSHTKCQELVNQASVLPA